MRDAISVPRVRSNETVSDGRTGAPSASAKGFTSELRNRQQPSSLGARDATATAE